MKDSILHPRNRFIWALLALQGGFVNIGGLLTVHIFVSHITGFAALFSNSFIFGDFLKSVFFLLVPVFFLAGSFFSSLFTATRKVKHEEPVYVYILLSMSFLFTLIAVLGHFQVFGRFGEPFENTRDFVLLSLLSFSCGTQNAIFTSYSRSIIRTTHLTGITTDLGIGLAKYLVGKDEDERPLNAIRVNLIVSFLAGSLLGALVFPQLEFFGFLIPAVICLYIGRRLYLTRAGRDLKNTVF